MQNKKYFDFLSRSVLLALVSIHAGCATFGVVYEDVGHPPLSLVPTSARSTSIGWDPNLNASTDGRALVKRGVACSQDILKLVAWGDATQAAAAKQGGITEVVGLDFENTAILGFIYTKNCTVVYGSETPAPAPTSTAPATPEAPALTETATEAEAPAAAHELHDHESHDHQSQEVNSPAPVSPTTTPTPPAPGN